MRASIVTHSLDAEALIKEVSSDTHGATALFLGTVRSINDARAVRAIEYTAYDAMAQREMQAILVEASEKNGGAVLVAEHRTGLLAIGEASIGIAAAHERRSYALDALRYAIDEMKHRVPVWKRELYKDGTEEWVDPTKVASK